MIASECIMGVSTFTALHSNTHYRLRLKIPDLLCLHSSDFIPRQSRNDQKKKCLFYASTLQQSIRENPSCSTVDAAERVGEELIKTCIDLNIEEISSYDLNGLARGARMEAFEAAISRHGFLS